MLLEITLHQRGGIRPEYRCWAKNLSYKQSKVQWTQVACVTSILINFSNISCSHTCYPYVSFLLQPFFLFIVLSIYLACSFRFIVNPTANSLDPGFYDSESPVPWEFIDCVIVPHTDTRTTSQSSMQEDHRGTYSKPGGPCPICLGELKIPRMTKCGHLFWWETFRLPARHSAMHCTALHCIAPFFFYWLTNK